jgi:micrococcal nuclease
MRATQALSLLWLLCCIAAVPAQAYRALVVSVHDGDSLRIRRREGTERIRLAGVDAPELEQPLGIEARSLTERLTLGQTVTIHERGYDRYGRAVADVTNARGTNVNRVLVKNGMAWWYQEFAPHDCILQKLQSAAQRKRVGVWAHAGSIPPWDYRRATTQEQAGRRHQTVQTAEKDFSMR